MSNAVFPTLPGLKWDQQRTVLAPPVHVKTTPSRREFRSRSASVPRYQYALTYEWLKSGARGTDLETLVGFFNARGGSFDSWLYLDPDDNSVTDQTIGMGDGAATQFQVVRTLGGFVEAVSAFNGSPAIYITDWQGKQRQYSVARTNLCGYSERFQSWTGGGVTVTTDGQVAPDGATTAEVVVEDTTTGSHARVKTIAITDGAWVIASLFVKRVQGSRHVRIDFYSGSNGFRGVFNLDTFAPSQQTAFGAGTLLANSAQVIPIGGGWYRCVVAGKLPSGVTSASFAVYLMDAAASGTALYTGDGVSSIAMWGGDVKEGDTLTSYIPTGISNVPASRTDYTLDASGVITLASAPRLGAVVSWSGSYYRRVRFLRDLLETSRFMKDLHEAKKVEFVSLVGES
ncbi:MAG: phage head spike fiber domain-containing protein [Pseudomonadota bacterium]